MDRQKYKCPICGVDYIPSHKPQKYCSRKCMGAAYSKRYLKLPPVKCQTCGTVVRAGHKTRQFCSVVCATKPEMRFWRNVDKSGDCWLWMGFKNKQGYGTFWAPGFKSKRVHRYSYFLHKGEIPEGMLVCHSCDNPSCVNPEHLFLGTVLDNVRDMYKKGRQPYQKGSKNPCAKLTEADVIAIRIKHFEHGISRSEIAKEYGVAEWTISDVLRRVNWSHVE